MSFLTIFYRSFSNNIVKLSIQKNAIGGQSLVQDMVKTHDGKMILAWHPDVEFPYEYSRPIPEQTIIDNGSLLKDNALKTAIAAFKNKHPEVTRQELMNLTYTTKHRWFPRSRDKKAKKTPMDRKYL